MCDTFEFTKCDVMRRSLYAIQNHSIDILKDKWCYSESRHRHVEELGSRTFRRNEPSA